MDEIATVAVTMVTVVRDVLPIAVILIGFQLFVLRRPLKNPARMAIGFVFLLVGLGLFMQGLETALFPLGRLMASQHPRFTMSVDLPIDCEHEKILAQQLMRASAELVTGAGSAGTPDSVDLARMAFLADPSPAVRARAMFAITAANC